MVIDSTDRERLAVTREELYRMLQHEDLSKASLLVYANKQVCTHAAIGVLCHIHGLRTCVRTQNGWIAHVRVHVSFTLYLHTTTESFVCVFVEQYNCAVVQYVRTRTPSWNVMYLAYASMQISDMHTYGWVATMFDGHPIVHSYTLCHKLY